MSEVAAKFCRTQGLYAVAPSNTLEHTSELRLAEDHVQRRVAHHDHACTCRFSRVSGRQCFNFSQRVRTESNTILDGNEYASVVLFQFFQASAERAESLDCAVRLILYPEFIQQQIQNVIAVETHSGNMDDYLVLANQLQCPGYKRRLAGSHRARNTCDCITGRERLLQARHRRGDLRSDEHVGAGRVGAKRPLLKPKVLFVHNDPITVIATGIDTRSFQTASLGRTEIKFRELCHKIGQRMHYIGRFRWPADYFHETNKRL